MPEKACAAEGGRTRRMLQREFTLGDVSLEIEHAFLSSWNLVHTALPCKQLELVPTVSCVR